MPSRKRREEYPGAEWCIPMQVEIVLHDMFGLKRFNHVHSSISLSVWRQSVIALFECFERAIRDTIVGDEHHKSRMREWCRLAVKDTRAAPGRAELLAGTVGYLAKLCLDLMGGTPNQIEPRRGSRQDWRVSRYRSVFYAKNATQSSRAIMDHVRWGIENHGEEIPTEGELWETRRQHRMDDATFVEWFRREFPKTYGAIVWG